MSAADPGARARGTGLIFMVSLPRSGSTLLQRILMTSPEVHSLSEPWLLLPLEFMLRRHGIIAAYGQRTAFLAFQDLLAQVRGGRAQYLDAIDAFVQRVYRSTSDREYRFFLDKTPRYFMILPFLAEAFPGARFIFLFRNPVAVLASVISTWERNHLHVVRNYVDVFEGPRALAEGARRLGDRALSLHYEDLMADPHGTVRRTCEYLGIDYDPSMIERQNTVDLVGRMGDRPQPDRKLQAGENPDGWRRVLRSRYRKWFARRYVRRLGDQTLREFRTSKADLIREIGQDAGEWKGCAADAFWHALATIELMTNFSGNYERWLAFRHNHSYSAYR